MAEPPPVQRNEIPDARPGGRWGGLTRPPVQWCRWCTTMRRAIWVFTLGHQGGPPRDNIGLEHCYSAKYSTKTGLFENTGWASATEWHDHRNTSSLLTTSLPSPVVRLQIPPDTTTCTWPLSLSTPAQSSTQARRYKVRVLLSLAWTCTPQAGAHILLADRGGRSYAAAARWWCHGVSHRSEAVCIYIPGYLLPLLSCCAWNCVPWSEVVALDVSSTHYKPCPFVLIRGILLWRTTKMWLRA
jgi:hypothetical protein